ncbi:MAG: DUF3795 domain-containing protein [Candidatus Firestonebacteria bacterium]
MRQIVKDKNLVAYCGLYCGACRGYLSEKCSGCQKNEKASWCKIRVCCIENKYLSCADCKLAAAPEDCKKFNNIISKIIAFIFRSNRKACIARIKEKGYDCFAGEMSEKKIPSIKG